MEGEKSFRNEKTTLKNKMQTVLTAVSLFFTEFRNNLL